MKKSKHNIDTGKLLNEFVTKNKITKADLGRQIGRDGLTVSNYLKSESIQTNTLLEICHATKYNFFQDLASMLPQDFQDSGITNDVISEKDRLIAQLQEENKVLKIQNEVLMKVRG